MRAYNRPDEKAEETMTNKYQKNEPAEPKECDGFPEYPAPPCLHLTTRNLGAALGVEVPQTHRDQHHFPSGTAVVIALENDPSAQIHATVWVATGGRRYATIRRKSEHAARFAVGKDVTVRLEADVLESGDVQDV